MVHLVLVGLMGAGKTSVGQECARRLRRLWIDIDELAVAIAGRPFDDIWADGEHVFRAFERQAIADAVARPHPAVISCGGGAVVDPDNRRVLREHGIVVWLRANPETLAARVGDGEGRPLLAGDPVGALRRLAAARAPAYEAAAHVVVDTDERSVDDIATEVVRRSAAEVTP